MLYDVFICHASEDKDSFVRPLAEELRKSHLEVWYDEFSLIVGDSLRESIDKGLTKSRYGIVVLSPAFFRKKWPQRELDGLVAREMDEPNNVILPIWHNITKKQVLTFSPPLADRIAIETNKGVKSVCAELLRRLRPQESPLIVARDELIHFGLSPPVVTDEWWLDVIEASNRIPDGGIVPPDNSLWGRWTFPLPNPDTTGPPRGVRLAWTAMQMQWEKKANELPITQISRPEAVLSFVASQPGLAEVCHEFPTILAFYAPQLTIKGFSGEFTTDFDSYLKHSIQKYSKSSSGGSFTSNGSPPLCDEEIALRHPTFGNYQPSSIACQFVQGDMFGPHPRYYDLFEYLIWFLSSESEWLPMKVHTFLLSGMKEWAVWISGSNAELGELSRPFVSALLGARSIKSFSYSTQVKRSLSRWIEKSAQHLKLDDKPSRILERFIAEGVVEAFFDNQKRRAERS